MRTSIVEPADRARSRINVRPQILVRAVLGAVILLGTAADIWGAVLLQHNQAATAKHLDVIAARVTVPPLAPVSIRD